MRRASGRFRRPLAQAPRVRRSVSGGRFGVRFDKANHVERLETHPEPIARHRKPECSRSEPRHSRATAYSTVTTAFTTFSTVDVS